MASNIGVNVDSKQHIRFYDFTDRNEWVLAFEDINGSLFEIHIQKNSPAYRSIFAWVLRRIDDILFKGKD